MYKPGNIVRIRAWEATGDPDKRKCKFCKEYDDIDKLRFGGRVAWHRSCLEDYNDSHRTKNLKAKRGMKNG